MATIEQWHSQDIEYMRGPDGAIQVERRYYIVDHADIEAWQPPAGDEITTRGIKMWMTTISVLKHEKGTKATIRVTYSSEGIEEEHEVEEFYQPIGGMQKVRKYCLAQHPHEFEVPGIRVIYGFVRWENEMPHAANRVYSGTVNKHVRGPFSPGYLMYLPPEASRSGEEKWRVTHRWMYDPNGWVTECEVPTGHAAGTATASRVITKAPRGRVDQSVLFTGVE